MRVHFVAQNAPFECTIGQLFYDCNRYLPLKISRPELIDHLTLAQVISEVLLKDLYQGERTSGNPLPAHHRTLQSQSLETFTFMLSIKFL